MNIFSQNHLRWKKHQEYKKTYVQLQYLLAVLLSPLQIDLKKYTFIMREIGLLITTHENNHLRESEQV